MSNFYSILSRNMEQKQTLITFTGIDGIMKGWKGICRNGRMLYQNRDAGIGTESRIPFGGLEKCGILNWSSGRVYYEKLTAEKKLVICGGGHVANAVIRIASLMNMPVTAVEDREEFAKMAEENGASQVICMPFSKALKQAEFTKDTYCLIMTRGHLYDKECLEYILKCRYGYLGLMGSRKRVAKLKTEMEEKGFDKKKLDEIHMPVGLNIHAETPTEIAVSIMAEIISLKNQNDRSVFYEKPVAEYLFSPDFRNESSGENKGVLITIIGKKGSAPREAGTKMIVTRSGRLLGTIGGGYLEAEGIRQAEKYLMRQGWESDNINICISSDNAAREGMYCGGEVELLLEGLV